MNILQKISHYLKVPSFLIVRYEEWQHVYFVIVRGDRPTFISKKMCDRVAEIKIVESSGDVLVADCLRKEVWIVRKSYHQFSLRSIEPETAQWYLARGLPTNFACPRFTKNSEIFRIRREDFKKPKTRRQAIAYIAA